ncbi:2-oxo-4-hydroxy-4-carboxy-5-ureidoimidazoline decarboxylase [Mangrovimicrobium sediminis]|uniref:2-oxo-4-hydroxy-4-carboxy-5-ureidoimidazoline decarboxylase n=1 Tax=Mangrovimicrobium sediminis TaxID=2562682 RepID=UPI001F0D1F14|nr:2-oxo-4-hydroxy-4-carboxy-5-ureidoimidazoline decarboxylase [Haliea sp. SAOS-164]
MSAALAEFNSAVDTVAVDALVGCCHCWRWAREVAAQRPFADLAALHDCAAQVWETMGEAEWLEAFAGHPRIGDLSVLRDKYSTASREQGQVAAADEAVLQELMQLNRDYEARHGFIFIVCASGKSAAEMRDLLRERLPHSTQEELRTGAAEQAKITALRLDRAFATDPEQE